MANPWDQYISPEPAPAAVPPVGRAPPGNSGIVPLDVPVPAPRSSSTAAPPGGGASRAGTVAFWMGKGAPQHVAEGIADRVNAESGFKPTVEGDGGTSVGLYQHHADRKDRLTALPDWQNPDVQHEHAYKEVTGADPIAAKHWAEIQAAPNRQTAAHLWDKYFERSKGSQARPWDGLITSAGTFKPNANGITAEQSRGYSVQNVDPRDFLAMLPPVEDTAESRRKGFSLLESLMGGDEVKTPPHITVSVKDGTAKIIDYDGRQRAQEAIKAGVDLIPVSFRGLPKDGETPKTIEGTTGVTLPFDFKPVSRETPQAPDNAGRRIVAAAGRGMEEAFQGFGPGFKDETRAALAGMQPGIGKEAATLGASALRTAELPFDVISRAVNAALMGAARGGGQAIGEVTGAARQPGFDPGIGAIREVIQPGMAFLGGAGTPLSAGMLRGGVGMLRGDAAPRPVAPALARPPAANAMVPGMLAPGWEKMLGPFSNEPARPAAQAAIENQARRLVAEKFAADAAGGGPSAGDAIGRMGAGRAEGQPVSLMDVGGENVRGLAGTAYRQPGEGRAAMRQFADDRDVTAPVRVRQLLDKYVSSGSAKDTAEQLIAERAANAKPLWDAAREGGRAIPIEESIAKDYQAAGIAVDKAKAVYEKAQAAADAAESGIQATPREPQRLTDFLKAKGGLRDDMFTRRINTARGRQDARNNPTELATIGARDVAGLVKAKKGMSLDAAAEAASEAGYLKLEPGTGRGTVNQLLDALSEDLRGTARYSEQDASAVQAFNDAKARNAEADRSGAKSTVVSPRELQFARDKADQARDAWRTAEDVRAEVRNVMEDAIEDASMRAKGAMWSPTLQRLLGYREIQQGINRGWAIEKRNAAEEIGQGKPFNPRDYAVIGEDAEGNPKVGAVPNMSLLMVAKEGLDAIIESDAMKNPLTGKPTKDGRSYIRLRQAFLNELDRLNPDYKPARDAWSGDTASISALNDGRHAFDAGWFTREELAEHTGKLSPNDREFFQLGMAEKLRDDLYRTADAGDDSKRIINNQDRRMRVRSVLGDADRADNFLAGVQRERQMFEARQEVMRGSQTQGRAAEDRAAGRIDMARNALDVGLGVGQAGHGHVLGALNSMLRVIGRATKEKPLDPEVYSAVGRLLIDPNLRMVEDLRGGLVIPPVRGIPEPGRGARFMAEAARSLPKVQGMMGNAMRNFGPPPPQ